MRKIIKQSKAIGDVWTTIDHGLFCARKNVETTLTMYIEDGRIYDEQKRDGKIYSVADVTDLYNEDGTEKT